MRWRKFVSGTEGSIMFLTALGLVAFLGLASLAIDMGHLYVIRNELQNLADAAALAGAGNLIKEENGVAVRDADGTRQAVITVVQRQTEIFGQTPVDFESRSDITVSPWPSGSGTSMPAIPTPRGRSWAPAAIPTPMPTGCG
ncbi:MAG: pilus assembly protein TadG-related protein [Desulfobaccales bacterium]